MRLAGRVLESPWLHPTLACQGRGMSEAFGLWYYSLVPKFHFFSPLVAVGGASSTTYVYTDKFNLLQSVILCQQSPKLLHAS